MTQVYNPLPAYLAAVDEDDLRFGAAALTRRATQLADEKQPAWALVYAHLAISAEDALIRKHSRKDDQT